MLLTVHMDGGTAKMLLCNGMASCEILYSLGLNEGGNFNRAARK
jgi:hypothetical protein